MSFEYCALIPYEKDFEDANYVKGRLKFDNQFGKGIEKFIKEVLLSGR